MPGEELVEMIQGVARQAMGEVSPMQVLYGTVTSASPLKIQVKDGLEVGASFLVLSALVRPFVTDVFTHRHTVDGKQTDEQLQEVEVWRGLRSGDKVRLLCSSDKQVYYVLDREEGLP